MATIHPHKGYLNTEFHLYAKGQDSVKYQIIPMTELTKDSMIEGCFKPNSPHSIRLDKAGSYLIQFSDSTTAEISVEDGYKFGGGRYKKWFYNELYG